MKVAEFTQHLRSYAKRFSTHFPRAHVVMAGGLTVLMVGVLALPSGDAEAGKENRSIETLALNLTTSQIETPIQQRLPSQPKLRTTANLPNALPMVSAGSAPTVTSPKHEPMQVVAHSFKKARVKSGDSLSVLFKRVGLNDRAMFEVYHSGKAGKALTKLKPGHEFTFELDADGKLVSLSHQINRLNSQTFTRSAEGKFKHDTQTLQPDVKTAMRSGKIKTSLYHAGKKSGMDEDLIMKLASIFGWDIDFALDIRKGDQFKLIFEESFLEGERLGSGAILAAEFMNQGTTFKAVRYVREDGDVEYYTPTGKAMEKAFLRAPLDFRRISSNFNPRRLHPISGNVRPHRGTDYAAARGTPIWSSGDGRVIRSGYTAANGNYVIIQHGNNIQTKYLHLHKRKVRSGQRVKQKQIIGTVGSTGYSTGPHLHYEFLLNGVHRNPRTIVNKLPKADAIPKTELPRFYKQTQPLLAELEDTTQMAANELSPRATTAL